MLSKTNKCRASKLTSPCAVPSQAGFVEATFVNSPSV